MTDKEVLQKAIEKYRVTKSGEVYNRKSGHKLKPITTRGGYKYICVYINKELTKKVKVHRMVCFQFLPNPENKPHVNHKNSNPSDNRLENLEWCTAKENVIHGFKTGRKQWNKGNISKSQIIRNCEKYPRKLFWMFTTNNFSVAKAFWGEEPYRGWVRFYDKGYTVDMKVLPEFEEYPILEWQYHLQQMVLCENPIDYIRKFIKDEKSN